MEFNKLLSAIINDNQLHARWLNTLSLMENTGARKISASEDPETVTYIILKHAAEEHRHAFYLKKQIEKMKGSSCPTYTQRLFDSPQKQQILFESIGYRCLPLPEKGIGT